MGKRGNNQIVFDLPERNIVRGWTDGRRTTLLDEELGCTGGRVTAKKSSP